MMNEKHTDIKESDTRVILTEENKAFFNEVKAAYVKKKGRILNNEKTMNRLLNYLRKALEATKNRDEVIEEIAFEGKQK